MISDQDVIILTCVVALCTLIAAIAYIVLISKFKQSISSNDDLKREVIATRSEISRLRSDLSKSEQDKASLKRALDDCTGGHDKET